VQCSENISVQIRDFSALRCAANNILCLDLTAEIKDLVSFLLQFERPFFFPSVVLGVDEGVDEGISS
jgi:hypothetical protein